MVQHSATCATLVLLQATNTMSAIVVGKTRITALSPTLLRLESRGPKGFEDRPTINVVGRDKFEDTAVDILNHSSTGTWLAAPGYHVFVPTSLPAPPTPAPKCELASFQQDTACAGADRTDSFPNGTAASSAQQCCEVCSKASECVAWEYIGHPRQHTGHCYPFSSCKGTRPKLGHVFGGTTAAGATSFGTSAIVATPSGEILWNGSNTGNSSKVAANLLHWPSPLESKSYAFMDSPRFTVPQWGPTPMPNNSIVAPGSTVTNGYDFTNDQRGDIYVFLLGDTLEEWWASRAEFLALTGPSPLLPDYAWGVWYTWYRQYTESQAKDEIGNWTKIKLPLDVWGLDMNWRNVGFGEGAAPGDPPSVLACHSQTNNDKRCRSHFYNHPNVQQLPGLGASNEWFDYLKSQKLK
jgi:hypothetical protein